MGHCKLWAWAIAERGSDAKGLPLQVALVLKKVGTRSPKLSLPYPWSVD